MPTWYCGFVLIVSHLCIYNVFGFFCRVLFLNKTDSPLQFKGNWLLTEPDEDQVRWGAIQARHFPIINKSRSVSYTPSRRVIISKGAPLGNDLEEVGNMYTGCTCIYMNTYMYSVCMYQYVCVLYVCIALFVHAVSALWKQEHLLWE